MTGRILAILGILALLGGGAALVLLRPWEQGAVDPAPPPPKPKGFREAARESGITFRMAFLPNEQGANFKINLYDHGCGVVVGDYDGDGHDDVYFLNQLGPNALYRNRGDGTFDDVTTKAGVALGDRICVAAAFADYDNDGHLDLYVTSTRGGNVLFRNQGDGTFHDVTKKAGAACVAHSQTATFFDYDNDGWLDLFVTNTAKWTLDQFDKSAGYYPGMPDFWEMASSPHEKNLLLRNLGDGAFADVTAQAGLEGKGWGGDVAVFDYDGDGRLDLFVTNMFGASQLYRNAAGGKFEDVTKNVLGRTSWGAIGCLALDFNNDGLLDLYVADMHSDMWVPQQVKLTPPPGPPYDFKKRFRSVMGPVTSLPSESLQTEMRMNSLFKIRRDDVLFGNTFFKQTAPGKFTEAAESANLETFWPWGIAAADFDNDGHQDVFLPSGMGYPYDYWPNSLLFNRGDETFADRTADEGLTPPPGGPYLPEPIGGKPASRSSRCAAVADFDSDGRPDLIVNNFNDHPYYYRNEFSRQSYSAWRLQGTKSPRDAYGAVVRLHIGKQVLTRAVHPAGGYLSQSSRTLHFGLGDATRIDYAEVRWPSGRVQRIDNPAVNQLHRVVEPKS